MGLFSKKTDKQKELLELLKERQKQEKEVDKKLQKRMESKYTSKYLKEDKKYLTSNAMEIDTLEYEKMVAELKKRFPDI